MQDFQQQSQLTKTLNRFKKIRAYSITGYNNIFPIKDFIKNAHKYQQVQLNTGFHFNAIIMDIDNEELLTEWNYQGLPVPTIQTLNKENDKAHLVWLLKTPVYKKHKHVVDYYKAIVNSIKKLIGADEAYQNHQTKNFLNEELYRVTYNDVSYELGDFKEFINQEIVHQNKTYEYEEYSNLIASSRHIHLFEVLRKYGYTIANQANLHNKLTQRAEAINQGFDEPIKVKHIVKSVLKFCEENKHNFRTTNYIKKVMKFKKIRNLPLKEFKKEVKARQSKSATRTTTIKKLKTSKKIKIAIDALLRHKKPIKPQNIAKQAQLSISTVKRNIKIVRIFTKKATGVIRSIRLIVKLARSTVNNGNSYTNNTIFEGIGLVAYYNITKWLFGTNTT